MVEHVSCEMRYIINPLTSANPHGEWRYARIQQKKCRSACVIQGLVRGVLARADFGKKIQAGSKIRHWWVSVKQRRDDQKSYPTITENTPLIPKAPSKAPPESWRTILVNFLSGHKNKPRFSHDVTYQPNDPRLKSYRHTTAARPIS